MFYVSLLLMIIRPWMRDGCKTRYLGSCASVWEESWSKKWTPGEQKCWRRTWSCGEAWKSLKWASNETIWRTSTERVSLEKVLKITVWEEASKEGVYARTFWKMHRIIVWLFWGEFKWGIKWKGSNLFLDTKKEYTYLPYRKSQSFVIRRLSVSGLPTLQCIGTVSLMSLPQTELCL